MRSWTGKCRCCGLVVGSQQFTFWDGTFDELCGTCLRWLMDEETAIRRRHKDREVARSVFRQALGVMYGKSWLDRYIDALRSRR